MRSEAKGKINKALEQKTISFGEVLLACACCGGACAGRGCGGCLGGGEVFDKLPTEEIEAIVSKQMKTKQIGLRNSNKANENKTNLD